MLKVARQCEGKGQMQESLKQARVEYIATILRGKNSITLLEKKKSLLYYKKKHIVKRIQAGTNGRAKQKQRGNLETHELIKGTPSLLVDRPILHCVPS